jgi:hypothetical protein
MALSTIGTNQIASEAVTVPKVADQVLSSRNMVINGAQNVAQRSSSVTGIGASSGYFTVDRFKIDTNGASAGRFTMTQTADGPSGFANCTKLDVTTADTSIAAGERLFIQYNMEGQDLQRIAKGTSDAQSLTLSFYVKGNAAATYVAGFYDNDNNRQVSKQFAVTTSWNRITLTFPPDTAGALDDDNASSLQLRFYLHAGSNYTSGTISETWIAADGTKSVGSGTTSIFDSTNRTFFITGIQLETGTSATPFEHEDYGTTLRKCQRYLYRLETESTSGAFANLTGWSADATYGPILYPVEMRSAPALSYGAALDDFLILSAGTNPLPTAILSNGSSKRMMELSIWSTGNVVAGRSYWSRISDVTNGFIQWDAEL